MSTETFNKFHLDFRHRKLIVIKATNTLTDLNLFEALAGWFGISKVASQNLKQVKIASPKDSTASVQKIPEGPCYCCIYLFSIIHKFIKKKIFIWNSLQEFEKELKDILSFSPNQLKIEHDTHQQIITAFAVTPYKIAVIHNSQQQRNTKCGVHIIEKS